MAYIKQIQRANTVYELTPTSVAAQFSSTTSYAVGDIVYFDGTLYRCTTAHTGAFVASHFTAVTVGAEIADVKTDLDELIHGGGGVTDAIKSALLTIAQKVAYVDDQGQTYYDALYDAFYPPAELVSISAVYTQGGTVYDTDSLDDLKSDLVVTAHYDDQTTATVTTYTLSGTLTEGTSTITVSYNGKTATFSVEVSAEGVPSAYERLQFLRQIPESTDGTTFINTGVSISSINNPTRIEAGIMYTNSNNDLDIIVGNRQNGGSNTYGFNLQVNPANNVIAVFNGSAVSITESEVKNTYFDVTAVIDSDSAEISDGTNSNSASVTARDYSGTPISIGGGITASGTSATYVWCGRIYYVRIYENDVPLLNCVPCRRVSDGVIGMYDFVSESFKTYYDPTDANVCAGRSANPSVSEIDIAEDGKMLGSTSIANRIPAGITVRYEIETATNVLYPAGILPYSDSTLGGTYLWVYDENGNKITYVYQQSGSNYRWAQKADGTLTEFSQSWTLEQNYKSVEFTVDLRHLDDAYMYDHNTGQVWFAGRNTPYYGMSNISEANE